MSEFARFCVAAVVVCVMSGLVGLVENWAGDWSAWTIAAFVVGLTVIVAACAWSVRGGRSA